MTRLELGPFRWAGLPLLLLGIAIYVMTPSSFTRTGKGTPGPWDPPAFLVRSRLYRYCRHPMY